MHHTAELTDDEVNYFYIEIGTLEVTMVKLQEEGIERLEDLVEFNAEDVNSVAEALGKSGGLVPSSSSARSSLVLAPRVHIGAKALNHLELVMHVMNYYEITNDKPAASHIRHDPVVKNFKL